MTNKNGNNLMTLPAGEYCIDYRAKTKVSVLNYSGGDVTVSDIEKGLTNDDYSIVIEDGTAANEISLQHGKLYLSSTGKVVVVRCK